MSIVRLRRRFKHAAPPRLRHAMVASVIVAALSTTGLTVALAQQSAEGETPALDAAAMDSLQELNDPARVAPAPASATAASTPPSAATPPTAAPPATAPPARPASKTLKYDYQGQINGYYCGPAATRIAVTAKGLRTSQDQLASKLGTTTAGTFSARDTTRVLNALIPAAAYQTTFINGQAARPADMDRLQADVVDTISGGLAVVANIVGATTDTAGRWHSYPGGHYVTIVGYSDKGRTVTVADPAYGKYQVTTIAMAHWIANRGYSAV